ncbi:MAG TPA: hypothetical protein VF810_04385, partial [Patescibacteria group bacterium]
MTRKSKLLLFIILFLAAAFRLYGLNWDQGYHLHPDERFLTMVANAMHLPHSFADYLNPQLSTFNPANIGFSFFVYGTFPLIFAKLLGSLFYADTYATFTLFGRVLSALADTLVVWLVFKTVEQFEKYYKLPLAIKFFAAFGY